MLVVVSITATLLLLEVGDVGAPRRRAGMPEVLAPDAVVPDVHDAVAVEVRRVAAVGLPEVLAPDAVVPDVHDAVAVDVAQDASGGRERGFPARPPRRGAARCSAHGASSYRFRVGAWTEAPHSASRPRCSVRAAPRAAGRTESQGPPPNAADVASRVYSTGDKAPPAELNVMTDSVLRTGRATALLVVVRRRLALVGPLVVGVPVGLVGNQRWSARAWPAPLRIARRMRGVLVDVLDLVARLVLHLLGVAVELLRRVQRQVARRRLRPR